MIVTFCGHSTFSPKPTDEARMIKILEDISKETPITFYLGGYGDFDHFAKHCAENYKKIYPESKLIFVSPYLGKWLDDRRDYIKQYDETVYPDIETVPLKFAISKRNEWMIRESDYVIAFVRVHFGGAYNSLLYADKHKKAYVNFYEGKYELY